MARTKDPKYNHNFPLSDNKDFLSLKPAHQKLIYLHFLKPISKWNNAKIYKTAYNRPDMKDSQAFVQFHDVMKSKKIVPLLHLIARARVDELNITVERILAEESYIAFSDFSDLFDEHGISIVNPKDMPVNIRRAIKSVEEITAAGQTRYKVTLWSKSDALKRLQGVMGMVAPKKHELAGPGGKPLAVELTHKIDLSALSDDELEVLQKLIERNTFQEDE